MAGQPQLPHPIPANYQLGIDAYELVVVDPTGVESNLIIESGSSFGVAVKFRVGGVLRGSFQAVAGPIITVQYFYEGLGGNAPEGTFNLAPVVVNSTLGVPSLDEPGSLEYGPALTVFNVLPPIVLTPGLYKLSAIVSVGAPWNMFGFVEGPIMRQL